MLLFLLDVALRPVAGVGAISIARALPHELSMRETEAQATILFEDSDRDGTREAAGNLDRGDIVDLAGRRDWVRVHSAGHGLRSFRTLRR